MTIKPPSDRDIAVLLAIISILIALAALVSCKATVEPADTKYEPPEFDPPPNPPTWPETPSTGSGPEEGPPARGTLPSTDEGEAEDPWIVDARAYASLAEVALRGHSDGDRAEAHGLLAEALALLESDNPDPSKVLDFLMKSNQSWQMTATKRAAIVAGKEASRRRVQ